MRLPRFQPGASANFRMGDDPPGASRPHFAERQATGPASDVGRKGCSRQLSSGRVGFVTVYFRLARHPTGRGWIKQWRLGRQ